MKLRHSPIVVEENTQPFKNCKLDREKYAHILTQLVKNYSDGFVLSINNEWGSGKTTFVKMWQQQLENEGIKTLYFNAWENDFESSPLVAILSELKTLTNNKDEKYKSLLKRGVSLTKSIIPTLVKSVAEKYIETGAVKDLLNNITNDTVDLFEAEVNEYATKKEGLKEFKLELAEYIKYLEQAKPLVFIVDELDRCRPDYAVEVLENIKHFFAIDGIVFVLSIDKTQLKNAICGFYGSDNLDSENYLKRFVDLEFNIPPPDFRQSVDYFYSYYEFDRYLNEGERTKYQDLKYDEAELKDMATCLFNYYKTNLREQEKLFARTRLILTLFPPNEYIFPNVLFMLVFLREFEIEIYQKINSRQLTHQQFIDTIEPIFMRLNNDENYNVVLRTMCQMLLLYSNYYVEINRADSLFSDTTSGQKLNIKVRYKEMEVINYIQRIQNIVIGRIRLDHLLYKINLTEKMKVVN